MIQLRIPSGETIRLKPANARQFRGPHIPGSDVHQALWDKYAIYVHDFEQPQFALSHRSLYFSDEYKLVLTEKSNWLRMETVLTGELVIRNQEGSSIKLLPGQYHITNTSVYQVEFLKDKGCTYFSAYFSPEFLDEMGPDLELVPITPRPLSMAMQELIYQMLDNPFDNNLRPFYYGNCIRELLFIHVSSPPFLLPGELTDKQIATVYEIDKFMADNLDGKITLNGLAKRAGTNVMFLKKAYEQVFGIGIFPRLVQRRMERAQYLLEKTDKPLKDICEMSGYETLAGFITEFRKKFGVTPKGWRKNRRGF